MKFKRRTFWIVVILVIITLASSAALNAMGFNHILTTIVSVSSLVVGAVGVILVYRELEMTNNIAEAEFISNINTTFVSNDDYKRVYNLLDYYQITLDEYPHSVKLLEISTEIENLDNSYISNYLTFFEVLNVLRKKNVLSIETIDNLFAYRFFIASRNPIIYKKKIKKGNFGNIRELHDIWVIYRKNKGEKIYGEECHV